MLFVSFVQIFWSDSGELVCIATEESFFILRYMADKVAASQENNEGVTEDGIEDAFEVSVITRCWIVYFFHQMHPNALFIAKFCIAGMSVASPLISVLFPFIAGPGRDPGNCEDWTLGRRLFHLHQLCEQTQLLCRR